MERPWILTIGTDHARTFTSRERVVGRALIDLAERPPGSCAQVDNRRTGRYLTLVRMPKGEVHVRIAK